MLMRLAIAIATLILIVGCGSAPHVVHQPTFHNPFPQLTRIGIAPFFNLSTEPTLDGRIVSLAYFNELQAIPGFEVIPVGTVETKAREMGLNLTNNEELRMVAKELKLDAIAIGAITDFSPYYPPRLGLRVDWVATNPAFHPIPTGYGLPWGTPEEEEIPQSLVDATEFDLAREQLKTQTPDLAKRPTATTPTAIDAVEHGGVLAMLPQSPPKQIRDARNSAPPLLNNSNSNIKRLNFAEGKIPPPIPQPDAVVAQPESLPSPNLQSTSPNGAIDSVLPDGTIAQANAEVPVKWPDPRGLIPPPPSPVKPVARYSDQPVMTHTRIYNGNDGEFTKALQNYVSFKDDKRVGEWKSYLQRSDDFIRFCCHLHLTEMLTARGGASETRVLWRWPESR